MRYNIIKENLMRQLSCGVKEIGFRKNNFRPRRRAGSAALTQKGGVPVIPLSSISVSPAKEKQFNKRGIYTVEDLLNFLPRKYKDFTVLTGAEGNGDELSCIVVLRAVYTFQRPGKTPCIIARGEEYKTGIPISVTWFRQNYLYEQIYALRGIKVFVAGKATKNKEGGVDFTMPSVFEPASPSSNKIIPVYGTIPQMSTEYLTSHIERATKFLELVSCETLPSDILADCGQISMRDALLKLHRPETMADVEAGRRRLTFDSLLYFALANEWAAQHDTAESPYRLKTLDQMRDILKNLPFELTSDQKSSINEICAIASSGKRLNVLLQGDVGCGKTIVAILAMVAMAENGFQSVLMAPTQVLASQHYADLCNTVEPLGYKVAYLRAGMKAKERSAVLAQIASGEALFIVGTHSVLSPSVQYKCLGLTVVDEEHKFGVEQRNSIVEKGAAGVHSITMSATPIPRSLAKAIFGDRKLVFTIETMPHGRKPVITGISSNPMKTLSFLVREIRNGHRAYVVCPLIEKSDSDRMADVDSVETVSEHFHQVLDPYGIKIGTVTGKMKKSEADEIIAEFKRGGLDVLISTTVIEVGVNVPEATMMIITNAERFGLSGLHQLRGRVGRSDLQSYCVLMSPKAEGNERLDAMVRYHSGFQIAEEDLRIRGAGDFLGTTQSGDNKYVSIMMANKEWYESLKPLARHIIDKNISCPLLDRVKAEDIATD